MTVRRFRIDIIGKVQGVGFRRATYDVAVRYQISGWIRNATDRHCVQLEAEGEEIPLTRFVEWLKQGPTLAQVDDLFVEEMAVQGDHQFEIRR